jgi:hypothetical protein
MNKPEECFFTILDQLGVTEYKIQENVPESAEESIKIS